jgi:hypothetical protein
MNDRIDIEWLSKITDVLVVLGGSEKRDWVPLQLLQRASEDGPRGSILGNPEIQLIDHLRSPPQGPEAGSEPALA